MYQVFLNIKHFQILDNVAKMKDFLSCSLNKSSTNLLFAQVSFTDLNEIEDEDAEETAAVLQELDEQIKEIEASVGLSEDGFSMEIPELTMELPVFEELDPTGNGEDPAPEVPHAASAGADHFRPFGSGYDWLEEDQPPSATSRREDRFGHSFGLFGNGSRQWNLFEGADDPFLHLSSINEVSAPSPNLGGFSSGSGPAPTASGGFGGLGNGQGFSSSSMPGFGDLFGRASSAGFPPFSHESGGGKGFRPPLQGRDFSSVPDLLRRFIRRQKGRSSWTPGSFSTSAFDPFRGSQFGHGLPPPPTFPTLGDQRSNPFGKGKITNTN